MFYHEILNDIKFKQYESFKIKAFIKVDCLKPLSMRKSTRIGQQ